MREKTCWLWRLVLFASAAHADADFIKGVYLQTAELCAQAKTDSLQTVIEAGNLDPDVARHREHRIQLRVRAGDEGDALAGLAGQRDLPGAGLSCFPTCCPSRR